MACDKKLYLVVCETPYAGASIHLDEDEALDKFSELSKIALDDKKVFKCSMFELQGKCIREEKTIKDPTI